MRKLAFHPSSAFFAFLLICAFTVAEALRMLPTLAQALDQSGMVTLRGNTRPEANSANDRGLVPDDLPLEHMLLQLRRPRDREAALRTLIDELHDPSSPKYHHWLTAVEFGEKFGVPGADLDAVTAWLRTSGFTVNLVYLNRMIIDFSGNAGGVRKAFRTEIHYLDVDGTKHIANMSDPQVPAAIAPVVEGPVSLHDFRPQPMAKLSPLYTFGTCFLGGPCYTVTPADLATIYNFSPLFSAGVSGNNMTIDVIEDSDLYSLSDWTNFRQAFGLSGYSAPNPTTAHPSGANNCSDPGVTGDDFEAAVDTEWAGAAAPSAAIRVVSCQNTLTTAGVLIAIENGMNGNSLASIVSVSYAMPETINGAAANAAINSAYQQGVAQGYSIFVAAGDSGADSTAGFFGAPYSYYGINVNGLASTPYNVAVGGTDFEDTYLGQNSTYWNSTNTGYYGSAKSYIPEIPWNDSCASQLIASHNGYSQTYGSSGFCNSSVGSHSPYQTTLAGGGGPSGCATGAASIYGVVSGTCQGYAKPSWQSVLGNPSDGVRDLPDVSLFAANGIWDHLYDVCYSDTANGGAACSGAPSAWSFGGGTSFGAPIMAGVQALVNQKAGAPWGNPNYAYYQTAATEYGSGGNSSCNSSLGTGVSSSCIFYDVTQGDMDLPCYLNNGVLYNCYQPSGTYGVLSTSTTSYAPAYAAGVGWDFATGIGTVNVTNLVNAIATPTDSVSPINLKFISKYDQPVTETAYLTNKGPGPLLIYSVQLSVGSDSSFSLTATSCPSTLASGNTCYAQVTFAPQGCLYNPAGQLIFSTDSKTGGQTVALAGETLACTP